MPNTLGVPAETAAGGTTAPAPPPVTARRPGGGAFSSLRYVAYRYPTRAAFGALMARLARALWRWTQPIPAEACRWRRASQ